MTMKKGLDELVEQLVEGAYPELAEYNIVSLWGRTSCFAKVSWATDRKNLEIICNSKTKKWHEAALYGLLSHELSHPFRSGTARPENDTDLDVIRRGLGPYLAAERATSGKYDDYIIKNGKDRYLGYRTIRAYLSNEESVQLDALLKEMRLVPRKNEKLRVPYADMTILRSNKTTLITVADYMISLDQNVEGSQVEINTKHGISRVYVDGEEVFNYRVMED
jgi:hypothetical protein